MRIAFITYEYPPDIAQGGIATYVYQAAHILQARGNQVEVFCGSHTRTISQLEQGVLVHRCITTNPEHFQQDIVPLFQQRQVQQPFDIMESPEIHTNAALIKIEFPHLPLVVKLHMASFIQTQLQNFYTTKTIRLRYFLGGVRQGKINVYGAYHYQQDKEWAFTVKADSIVAPSQSQKDIIVKEWHLPENRIAVIPNPFQPNTTLLNIPVNQPVKKSVTFVGKLNVHKGMVNLVKIIPLVVKQHPDVVFNLIGNDSYFTVAKMKMSAYIRQKLIGYEKNYRITGGLNYDAVLQEFSNSAVCIFPSLWECFGLVCLEAMSAGKAVIGSSAGGMADILNDGAGILTDPHNVNAMAQAINDLLNHEDKRWAYGQAARAKVLANFNSDIVGQQMEAHYRATIANCKKLSLA